MSRSDRFLKAIRGEAVDTTPIWIMRQAGRYLPEYRATRAKAGDFLTLCKTPELACEVTLQPIDKIGVDAAILFSDILIPLEPMGVPLAFPDEGPRLSPVRDEAGIDKLRIPDPEAEFPFVMDAIRLIRRALDGRVPLIGFAGAPFTMLTYVVEGQTGKQFAETKKLLFGNPTAAHKLLQKLADTVAVYLAAQVKAGAQTVQIFDSWVGQLGPDDFRTFAAPYVQQIVDKLKPLGAPIIYFANDGGSLLGDAAKLGADALGVDWRTPLDEARAKTGDHVTLQGNLDPCLLFAPIAEIERRTTDVMRRAAGKRHIFNLGHGILPGTPPEHAQALVEIVHRLGQR
ncbi:MAG TPA: uroporphyrinogen decarboxylase [Polyangia bacterium]|jgi:uroporphyrinogen decarboxylase|nr:uroporphyrinogen decarboxylase [Polyangia bacterium]